MRCQAAQLCPVAQQDTIGAGYFHTAALKADGTVVAAGWNESGQGDTGAWNSIRIP